MDWNQVSEGLGYGFWLCFIAGAGRVFYWLGAHRYDERPYAKSKRGENINKLKAICEGLAVAAVLGLIASRDYVQRDGGDYLYDPGEIVDVVEEEEPYKSFASIFMFAGLCWTVGVMMSKE
tara:strand:- start:32276 stop:32638 length:363 start_codon:yes stop_codon:yes gene_type:complete